VTKKELVRLLKPLLAALIEAETPPPSPMPAPAPPPPGHAPHLIPGRFGCDFCCPEHEQTAFMGSGPATETLLDRLDQGARAYIRERFGGHPQGYRRHT
jgi:hypothetical protein